MSKIKKDNLLITVHPEIALDWDQALNERPLNTISVYSHYNAHWKCHVCGHTWDAVVGSRSLGRGCPACGGQIVIKGKNDLATKFPEIAAEWDYEKNAPITPDGVSFGAIKKYSWICPKCGYTYDASVNQRTNSKSGCPYCSNHKVMPGYNDFAAKYPELAKEWDFDGNSENSNRAIYRIISFHKRKGEATC